MRQIASTYAARNLPNSDLSVVGPPSLPAGTVNSILARLGSPMMGAGALVEQTSRQTNIDDAFALAVWWTETNDGATGVGLADRNPGSVRGSVGYPSAYDGYTIYPSYAAAIVYWFHMLKNVYVNRGLSTVYVIAHPYVGTSNAPLWAGKVVALMQRYRGEAPPASPSPTVIPSPTIPPNHRHRTGANDPGSNTNAPPQKKTQNLASQPAQTRGSLFTLSPTATALIVIFALLLAFAVALWGRSISTSVPCTPPLHALARPLNETRTDALLDVLVYKEPAPTTDSLYPFPRIPSSTGKLRRTLLLPALPDTRPSDLPEEATIPTERRPTGLLARYGTGQLEERHYP